MYVYTLWLNIFNVIVSFIVYQKKNSVFFFFFLWTVFIYSLDNLIDLFFSREVFWHFPYTRINGEP
jgi:hypothetical protein